MTRDELLAALGILPAQIDRAEVALLESRMVREHWEDERKDAEAALLRSDAIDGKNAEVRAAQLRQGTAGYRETAENLARKEELARIHLHRFQAEFSAAKAIARLLAGAEE